MGGDSESSRQDGGLNQLDCFIRFDEVIFWLLRTLDLIATAETHRYGAYWGSFRMQRRESRKAEFALVIALYRSHDEMEERASDGYNR